MNPAASALLGLALAACASTSNQAPTIGAFIAPGVFFAIAEPQRLRTSVEAIQLATASYRGDQFIIETRVSISPQAFAVLSFDALGRRALRATRTPQGLEAETADWVPRQLRAESILADLIIMCAPADVLREALAGTGAALSASDTERTIQANGREIVRVDYDAAAARDPWSGRIKLSNVAFGYAIELRTARVSK